MEGWFEVDDFEVSKHEVVLPKPIHMITMKVKGKREEPDHMHIDMIYHVYCNDGIQLDPEIGTEAKWMSKEEILEADTFESIKSLAREILI